MNLAKQIRIARRFQKSIRIDADFGKKMSLDGYVCPQSSADILLSMAKHVSETGHGAFTWTGPYGGGKSSLAVALSTLLNGSSTLRERAVRAFGKKLSAQLCKALPARTKGWRVVPIVGRRDNPVTVIGEAIKEAGFVTRRPRGGWTEGHLIDSLLKVAISKPKTHGGLILFVDEMGKFLEAASQDGTDVYIFQQLAEASSRSNGRLLVIGVLHQAFEEYAHHLSHETRDEWAKIQGRFIDLPINVIGGEQIDLISRAIENDRRSSKPSKLSMAVAQLTCRDHADDVGRLAKALENCWPLHPVVTCLLGPISRRRFGQNQRSIFSFLNSSEPHGFQAYLRVAKTDKLYEPRMLWDYLRANLEPSILASPDGHRWAIATEALERCEVMDGDIFHINLLKTILVIDLFRERSGLTANFSLLKSCFPKKSDKSLKKGLSRLTKLAVIMFKKFQNSYAVSAGSDFNISQTIKETLKEIDEIDFSALRTLAGPQPILAKRHYYDTGTMRWFDVSMVPMCDVVDIASSFKRKNGIIGECLLVIPTRGENENLMERICHDAAKMSAYGNIIVGLSQQSQAIVSLARELLALNKINNGHPDLVCDPVARCEVSAQLTDVQTQLETKLNRCFSLAKWYCKYRSPRQYSQVELSGLVSAIADKNFDKCPRLHNELLNRQKPSASAVAAQNALLRCMIKNEGELRLGIEGYPAEGGLFASIIGATGLYVKTRKGWHFKAPTDDETDTCNIFPAWDAATQYIQKNKKRPVSISEIYEAVWSKPPHGVEKGLIPVLSVAFILSQRKNLAIYREGIFRAHFDEIDVEYLAKDAETIQLRWMVLNDTSRRLLSDMAKVVHGLTQDDDLSYPGPIDVARGLVAIYEQLPKWTKRTMRLSANAVKVRDAFKRACDPNKFLFDDIPTLLEDRKRKSNTEDVKKIVSVVREGLQELILAYPLMLQRIRDIMLAELQVPNLSRQSLEELNERAENIRGVVGDFRTEAFVVRMSKYDGSDIEFEGIASLVADKPPRDWIDMDANRATMMAVDMAQKFLRAETFARIKGRPEKRRAMAVVVGIEGQATPLLEEFDVADSDRETIKNLIDRISTTLESVDMNGRNIVLAALAELSARHMSKPIQKKQNE